MRVPVTGGEKESLHASMRRHRDAVTWKLEGLDDEQLRRVITPSGTSLLGLVKHLTAVEYGWFCHTFGRETGTAWWGDPVSMRWVLIHMIEETARHAGHVDIVRELIDGQVGDHRLD